DFAASKQYRSRANPAEWAGNLSTAFDPVSKVAPTKHRAGLDYRAVPAFMQKLRSRDIDVVGYALQFLVLCGVRSGDLLGKAARPGREAKPAMRWADVDFEKKLWVIERTKNGDEHVVPLTDPALTVLKELKPLGLSEVVVFPSLKFPDRA